MANKEEKYGFIAEWYDPSASLIRRYQLLYYTADESIEMFDIKNRRLFLKRSQMDNLKLKDLFIGATINILSRHLNIVDYSDEVTRKSLGSINEQTLAAIKPDALNKMGAILDRVIQEGFIIGNAKMVQLTRNEAAYLHAEHEGKKFFDELMALMIEAPLLFFTVTGHNAVKKWREIMGPTDPAVARRDHPKSIRAQFGTNMTRNACHGSDSQEAAAREVELAFGAKPIGRRSAMLSGSTLGIIKPHAVAAGLTGKIIEDIQTSGLGLQVTGLELRTVDKVNAEEFYEVYKGVVSEFKEMIDEMIVGPCMALEVSGPNAHSKFREFVGPADPEIARHLRPHTLRAKYGVDKVKNAIHCTDLPEDASLETQYFFNILK